MGLSQALIEAIQSTYTFHNEVYKIGGDTTEPVNLNNGLRQGSVLSPILFILYINNLLQAIQETKEGAQLPGVTQHNAVSGLMFVDDLHIFANSILGLTTIISTVIKQALQEDIIINMDKSAIYLDKQQMEQTELIQHIKKCPILKHLQIQVKQESQQRTHMETHQRHKQ